ncbi:hypothetical protein [Dyadobacter sp. CY326]|uniref:hypothetical protein n=1 Tax=Dyadobacter sp. CY326 TaxID=2907300 RepID=UPI001F28BE9F|nr:hypothetical protein [Dyadobacter sp. CY326]MCE7063874.1 hypothetical protein [Dyadobacter sp. CY326]
MMKSKTLKNILIVISIVAGLLLLKLFLLSGHYSKMIVTKPVGKRKLTFVPYKDSNAFLTVGLDGLSNENYTIKIDAYYYDSESKRDKLTSSEVIQIPGGRVEASFQRDYYGSKGKGKVEVTLTRSDSALGEIEVTLTIN